MLKQGSRLARLLMSLALLGAMPGLAPAATAEQKVALVIGNSAYPAASLRNPVNDASAMAKKLRALGFDVILKTDSNLREMTRAISQFGEKLTLGSVGLFYYAGHGMQVRGKNFLIPVDAEIKTEGSVRSEAVDVDQVLEQLGPARLSMVILDACRNNPFERRFRSVAGGGLAQIDAPTGTLLAYATAPGKVASDGTGSNGLYTEALLKAIDTPGLKVEDVFKQVRINVLKESDNLQTPWESSSLTGEFYFRPDNKAAAQEEKLKQAERERQELLKEVADERKQREQDARALKLEMEKLRAELLALRVTPAAAPATQVASARETAAAAPARPAAAPAQPVSRPAAAATAAKPKPAEAPPPASPEQPVAVPAAKPAAPEQKPQVVALAAPSSATKPASSSEWESRIALLERSRGQLTLAKATAILLDISDPEQLTQLLAFEGQLKRMSWQSAYAIGAGPTGNLSWGSSYRWGRPEHAEEKAMENCTRHAPNACKVVMKNGEFDERVFIDVAKQFGKRGVTGVKTGFLKSVANWQGKF